MLKLGIGTEIVIGDKLYKVTAIKGKESFDKLGYRTVSPMVQLSDNHVSYWIDGYDLNV